MLFHFQSGQESAKRANCRGPSTSWHVEYCFTSTDTVRTVRDGEPMTSTSTFTQLLSSEMNTFNRSVLLYASTETVPTVRDGEPRTATSTFTQPLGSEMNTFAHLWFMVPSLCFYGSVKQQLIGKSLQFSSNKPNDFSSQWNVCQERQ